jgi:uncharacterized protein
MIPRRIAPRVEEALSDQAAVALIGPRQVGKTTLALEVGHRRDALYLDLEDSADRSKLREPRLFLQLVEDRLVILDEIHRLPELLPELRGIIDRVRRRGRRTGRFLLLGSASLDLLRHTGETLAGRIAYVPMGPLDILEVGPGTDHANKLWLRGGYPDSFLAASDRKSLRLRRDFVRTYLERDVALLGPRLPAETLQRLWTMLAHGQGGLLNASRLASSLGTSAQTVTRYIGLLCDLLLVRRLSPLHPNLGKRLVKSPKVYVRDSGLLHVLLGIETLVDLTGHPACGGSWEGFAIENLLSCMPERTIASFFRTAAGAEMDLVLDLPQGERWAVEIKLGLSPSLQKGFHQARADLQPDRSFVVYSGEERYPMGDSVEAIGLRELATVLVGLE